MNWNTKKLMTWDIESEGLDVDSDITCISLYDGKDTTVFKDLEKFMDYIFVKKYDVILVGYNTENWKGGFDVPFIRTYCILHNIPYRLNEVESLDLLPIIRKYFNTTLKEQKTPNKSSLYKGDLVKLAEANGLEYTNKRATYSAIEELEEPDWLNYVEEKNNEYNSLQKVYQMWFDPDKEEEYMSGGDVEKLNMEEIIRHNENDVIRTYKILDKVVDVTPDWVIDRNIQKL